MPAQWIAGHLLDLGEVAWVNTARLNAVYCSLALAEAYGVEASPSPVATADRA